MSKPVDPVLAAREKAYKEFMKNNRGNSVHAKTAFDSGWSARGMADSQTVRELLAALEAITPHAWGHNKPGCKGKERDPENCDVCKAIWAARDAIAKAKGRQPS